MKKATALLLLAALLFAFSAGCGRRVQPPPARPTAKPAPTELPTERPPIPDDAPQYTYTAAFDSMASCWDPHRLKTKEDGVVSSFLTSPLVARVETDTEAREYEWVFEMAENIEDVTFTNRGYLEKYGCELGGVPKGSVNSGYVFRITLRPSVWEDGTPVTADSFIYSMRRLLDPALGNPGAEAFVKGPAAIAGGESYYVSGREVLRENAGSELYSFDKLKKDADGFYKAPSGERVYWAVDYPLGVWLDGGTPKELVAAYGEAFFPMDKWNELLKLTGSNGLAPVTDETYALMSALFSPEDGSELPYFLIIAGSPKKLDFDKTVGICKVDELVFDYVCGARATTEEVYSLLSRSWLVYEPYCEKGAYGTSPDNTMSCGPYRLVQSGAGRILLERNPNWYGWETAQNGDLISFTGFHVNGEHLRRFETTRVEFVRLTSAAAREGFLSGRLTEWTPEAGDIEEHRRSERLRIKGNTDTVCLLINADASALADLDLRGNVNSSVLGNLNFRRALEICIDRAEAAKLTAGYSPCLGLINENCLVDKAEASRFYRDTEQAMQALCDHYGAEFGEGAGYATLEAAYESLTGFDPVFAGEIMRTACEELAAEGLYTEGAEILIRVAWSQGDLTAADGALCELISDYMSAAAADSGFGRITLVPMGHVKDPASAVSRGEYAMGLYTFSGEDAFRSLGVFLDPEDPGFVPTGAACSEPASINVGSADVTMTRQEWEASLTFPGRYADAEADTRLTILAELERQCLERRSCIPLFSGAEARMLSEKAQSVSDDPGGGLCFGCFELLAYNYNDAEWEERLAAAEE
ncbi:MAG: hypothetical protein K6G56_03690 [Clostridiales bacterium]|nr:hypothetical protein [Clostridiales bacterium]